MAETKNISCPALVYTAISTAGQANVSFKAKTISTGRMAVATSLPGPSSTDYVGIDSDQWTALGSLGVADIVYFMPDGSVELVIEVVRG